MSKAPEDRRPSGLGGMDHPVPELPLFTREAQYNIYMSLLKLIDETAPGMTVNQLRVWEYIEHGYDTGQPAGVTEIARALGMSKSYVSETVRKGLDTGWLREEPHPEDRRRRLLLPSEQAHERRRKIWQQWRKHWRESVLVNADTLLKMGVIDAATRRAVQISIDLQI